MGRYRQRRFPSPCGWRCGDHETPADREARAGAAGPSAALGTLDAKKSAPQVFVAEFGGAPVKSVKTALATACKLAKVDAGVTAYALRHTCDKHLAARCEEIIRSDQAILDNLLFQQAKTELAAQQEDPEPVSVSDPVSTKSAPSLSDPQTLENIGGPGGNRTPNQTVMSGRL